MESSAVTETCSETCPTFSVKLLRTTWFVETGMARQVNRFEPLAPDREIVRAGLHEEEFIISFSIGCGGEPLGGVRVDCRDLRSLHGRPAESETWPTSDVVDVSCANRHVDTSRARQNSLLIFKTSVGCPSGHP